MRRRICNLVKILAICTTISVSFGIIVLGAIYGQIESIKMFWMYYTWSVVFILILASIVYVIEEE